MAPPIPIGEPATRADVAGLGHELKTDLNELSLRFDTMNHRIDRMFITQILGLVTVVGAIFASNAIF